MEKAMSVGFVKGAAIALAVALLGGCCFLPGLPGLDLREKSLGQGNPPSGELRSAGDETD